jgi:hypothetical protein
MPGIMINSLTKRPGQKKPSLFASSPSFNNIRTAPTSSRTPNDPMSLSSSSCHSRITTTTRSRGRDCNDISLHSRYSDHNRTSTTSYDALTVTSNSTASSSTSSSRSSSVQPSPKVKHQHRYANLWGRENANEKGTWGHFIDFEHSSI